MASELIIQLQKRDGSFSCEKFEKLPSPKSAYVVICFTNDISSEQLAISLKTDLINSITNLGSDFINSNSPCGGNAMRLNSCQALRVADNLKLLIVVSDGTNNSFANTDVHQWAHTILPILKIAKPITLPNPFNMPQVAFWSKSIDEVIPIIWGLIGISEEDQRIFISYRRSETTAFAEQLFDRLHHEGFEVFLDRFSIEPSVNFQNRLYQELADKAMVLFLESPDFQNSQWIQLEINFAKKYRLGFLAININKSPKISYINDEYRRDITLKSFKGKSKLNKKNLDLLVNEIKIHHSNALYRKRNYLNSCIIKAVESKGGSITFDSKGFISVINQKNNCNYKIWTTPRPPKIKDFHHSDISNPANERIIVGPKFMEENREILNRWLGKKVNVKFYNEGQLLKLTHAIFA